MKTSRRLQGGVTMLEMLGVLGIAALLSVTLIGIQRHRAEQKRVELAADHAKRLIPRVQDYIKNNYTSIVAGAGPTTAVTITPAQMASYMDAGYSDRNAYGQTFQVRVIEPTPNMLDALILYSGGETLNIGQLEDVAAAIGYPGGWVDTANPNVASGVMGQWSRALSAYGGNAGTGRVAVAVFADDAMRVDDALHRTSTPGKPELNRMSTAIDMAGNNINSAGTVDAGELKGGNVAIGSNRYGGATWPYETLSLPAGNAFRFNIGGTEQAALGGDGWLQSRYGMRTSYMNTWDLNAGGGVYANSIVRAPTVEGNEFYANGWFRSRGQNGWYQETYGGGFHMTDYTWIRAYNGKSIYTSGELRGNRVSSEGRITSGEFVQIDGVSYRGWGCNNGLLAREPDGTFLFCQNGVFKTAGGPTTGYYTYLGLFTSTYVGYNTSPYTSQVIVSAQAYSCGNNGYSVQMYVNGAWVGVVQDNNRTDAKVGHATISVPAGGSFQITPQYTSYCYTQAHVWQYTQQ